MRRHDRDLDDELRAHIALSVRERVAAGEDPVSARRAALVELGNPTLTKEAMRAVWRPAWLTGADSFRQDLQIAMRSLARSKGLALTVAVTLALGIGANAAIFSVVRHVLLTPLVNRDAASLVYISQRATGLGDVNATFSVPEIADFKARAKTISAFGDFAAIDFPVNGLGDPRVVKAGVVSGSFFEVMGLRPALGRLINAGDDGPDAAGVAVITHRFWMDDLKADPAIVGKVVQFGTRSARIVGVLEPAIPYPVDTAVIANIVTSPHHLDATMVTGRTHRMTDLFGRLVPGATLEDARTELGAIHAELKRAYPDAYAANANFQIVVTPLREQITAPARTILLILLAAAALVFAIACSNVTNLILARTARRERELTVRASLGASAGALRRTLLAESLLMCGGGAILGVLVAYPLVAVVGRFASRYSPAAAQVRVDSTVLWVGAGLAVVAAIVLAYVPRLRTSKPKAEDRLRTFATAQVALSFVLLVAAGSLLTTLFALQKAYGPYDADRVLAIDVPLPIEKLDHKSMAVLQEMSRRVGHLPTVERVALGNFVPWRDAGALGAGMQFAVEGRSAASSQADPHGHLRIVTPGFFDTVGVPIVAGRDFGASDTRDSELVVVVSQSLANQLLGGDAVGRRLWWTDQYFGKPRPRRVVGVAADADDERLADGRAMTIYHPLSQMPFAHRMFVRTNGDPQALVPQVTSVIHELSPTQPVERAETLAEVRRSVLGPERLNAFVLAGFAGVALLIAVVGVAGVLAFSVSARTREFGVRLAVGMRPSRLMAGVLGDGSRLVAIGIGAGTIAAFSLAGLAGRFVTSIQAPDVFATAASAFVLFGAAATAALMPALRASRVDVVQALRSE